MNFTSSWAYKDTRNLCGELKRLKDGDSCAFIITPGYIGGFRKMMEDEQIPIVFVTPYMISNGAHGPEGRRLQLFIVGKGKVNESRV
jgi:hypothetical protein